MAPKIAIPEEIDLFTGPHSRMKELVNIYTEKVQCVDFGDLEQLFSLLDELKHTLFEFKSHESIENMFIMDQLKNRLKQRHIYNSAVCNCHNDNRITEMLLLVKNGKYLQERGLLERQHFGQKLQEQFSNFVKEFVPHMEEEENIFQPLLVEHFDYDELRILKEAVVEQHELIKDPQYFGHKDTSEIDEAIKDCRDLDESLWNLASFFDDALNIKNDNIMNNAVQHDEPAGKTSRLPVEILVKIFHHLKPPDLGRCAQVCREWNSAVYSTCLWREIYPIQWSKGIWDWENVHLDSQLEDQFASRKMDDDADIDEAEGVHEQNVFRSITKYLLPRIGKGVRTIVMDGGYHISPISIRKALKYCPNIRTFSAAYTQTTHQVFTNVKLHCLELLDLQGCYGVNDALLHSLLNCIRQDPCNPANTTNCSATIAFFCPYSSSCMQTAPLISNEERKFCYCRNHWVDRTSWDIEECFQTKSIEVPSDPTLKSLNLSGCHGVQGYGLLSLSNSGILWNLRSLNLSGCFQIASQLLNIVALQCPNLSPDQLTYCDNIENGPYPAASNGCDSLCHPLKVCCRSSILN